MRAHLRAANFQNQASGLFLVRAWGSVSLYFNFTGPNQAAANTYLGRSASLLRDNGGPAQAESLSRTTPTARCLACWRAPFATRLPMELIPELLK